MSNFIYLKQTVVTLITALGTRTLENFADGAFVNIPEKEIATIREGVNGKVAFSSPAKSRDITFTFLPASSDSFFLRQIAQLQTAGTGSIITGTIEVLTDSGKILVALANGVIKQDSGVNLNSTEVDNEAFIINFDVTISPVKL